MSNRALQGAAGVLVLLTVAVALLVAQSARLLPTAPALTRGEGIVATVLAGDRLQLVSGDEVQLATILAPPPADPHFEQALQATRALAEGQRVRLEPGPGGAYVYLPDGRLLQGLLVEAGYAEVRGDAPSDAMVHSLRAAQRQAQADGVGRWRLDPTVFAATPPPTVFPFVCEPGLVAGDTIGPNEAAQALGRRVTVVFNAVSATTDNGSVTFLSGLDADQFGVLMPFAVASTLDDPEIRYLNRCLVVRGTVELAPGNVPRIIMRTAEDLKILQ